MRKFTTEHTVYKFDELSEEAKTKALDRFRETEDMPFLEDYMTEELEVLLKENKLYYEDLPKVYYSLSYCQGDGAMFEGTVTWQGRYTAHIKQSGHYYHYNSKEIELLTASGNEASLKKQEEFNELYVKICKQLEKHGYSYIEDALSDETLTAMIEANEYEFTEEGDLVQC